MKKALFITALCFMILCFPIIYLACTSGEDEVKTSLGEEFTLPAGKTAVIEGEDLSLKFVEVTSDSRCPSDVVCVQMGSAKCDVVFIYQGRNYPVTLEAGGEADDSLVFTDYTVEFNLQPYPVSSKQIKPEEYKLVMTISK